MVADVAPGRPTLRTRLRELRFRVRASRVSLLPVGIFVPAGPGGVGIFF
jgi:hypothetical protein